MRGGQKGNRNAQKYLPVGMPEGVDIGVRDGYVRFIIHVIGRFAAGKVSGRDYGTLSQWVRMLGDVNGWIAKAPLQIIQAQAVVPVDLMKLLEKMNADEQVVMARFIKRLERESQGSQTGP